ncbi:MAG: hypothetical protein J3Q66DRAFT_163784 [Benniella sp.]|nr:MAG: hypothetical protein J3Q66DRAFT_163784 [Benniella sp.]
MLPVNPLDIPEILLCVASYLKPEDIARYLSVSKFWYNALLPLRWRTVRVVSRPYHSRFRRYMDHFGPRSDILRRHQHLILDLTIVPDRSKIDPWTYSNLKTLTLGHPSKPISEKPVLSLDLKEMFPSVAELNLNSFRVFQETWLSLSTHSHITTLSLYDIRVRATHGPVFWRLCAKLENLALERANIEVETTSENAMFDRMRQLKLVDVEGLKAESQLDLIIRCPNLKGLHWRYNYPFEYHNAVNFGNLVNPGSMALPLSAIDSIPKGNWPYLEDLDVEVDDADLASILGGIGGISGGLRFLKPRNLNLCEQVSSALGRHYNTLVKLELGDSFFDEDFDLLNILCNCHSLEILHARGGVDADDVAMEGPWTCRLLRELTLGFWFDTEHQDFHQDVLERLSALDQLESLGIFYRLYDDSPKPYEPSGFEFRLDRGLGQLASLRQLKSLTFVDGSNPLTIKPQLGMEEVEWMTTNWTQLRRVAGQFNRSPEENAKLKDAFIRRGIEVCE